jgi:hypothetical protein
VLFIGTIRFGAFIRDRAGFIRTAGSVCAFLPAAVTIILYLACHSGPMAASRVDFSWGSYFRSIIFEFGWWLPLLGLMFARLAPLEKRLLIAVLPILAVIPVIKAPAVADFIMRTSMPALFVLFLTALSAMRQVVVRNRLQIAIVCATALFLVSSWITPIYEMARSIQRYTLRPLPDAGHYRVASLSPPFARQYIGDRSGFFFKYLARDSK